MSDPLPGQCGCGCGTDTGTKEFAQGHDQTAMHAAIKERWGTVSAFLDWYRYSQHKEARENNLAQVIAQKATAFGHLQVNPMLWRTPFLQLYMDPVAAGPGGGAILRSTTGAWGNDNGRRWRLRIEEL
jgi:hypothetical protein